MRESNYYDASSLNSRMFYRFLKVLMTVALRLFYRRIYVTGMEVIPPKGPVILLANHPSALMDAALIGILLKREVHFFTKGDVFVNKPVSKVLHALNMIPIHDHERGRNSLTINDDSYEKAASILTNGGIVLFFPEGNSKTHHKLMPLRKGGFRMAFQTAIKNKFTYDIPFIPVGINYEHPTSANTDVMVHFNTPFYLSDYRASYAANPAATLLQMTKDGFNLLERKVLHIHNPANFEVAGRCLIIHRNNYKFFSLNWLQATSRKFELEKFVCDTINSMPAHQVDTLKASTSHYFNELETHSLKDYAVAGDFYFSKFKGWLVIRNAPFYLISWLLNALPFLIGKRITDRYVKRTDYYSWILVLGSMVLYIVWLLVLGLGFGMVDWRLGLGIPLITVFFGLMFHNYPLLVKAYRQSKKIKKQKKENPQLLPRLQYLRKGLLFTNAPE